MKALGITSTALLSLLLAVAAPAWAQEQHEQEKDKPAQQEEKKAQPEKSEKQAEKPAVQQEKNAMPEERNAQHHTIQAQPEKQAPRAGGRIPDDRFKANFGRQHTFRVSQGDYRNHRFQYGGYSFGFIDAWPSNWLYTQNVYVVEINGVYYLCNPAYPGVNITLSIVL